MRTATKRKPVYEVTPITVCDAEYRDRLPRPKRTRPRSKAPIFTVLLLLVFAGIFSWFEFTKISRRLAVPTTEFASQTATSSLPALRLIESQRISHTIRSGESLPKLAERYGLDTSFTAQIREALQSFYLDGKNPSEPRPGVRVSFLLNTNGEVEALQFPMNRDITVRLNRSNGVFTPQVIEEAPEEVQVTAVGEIRSSFAAAASKAGVPYGAIDELVDLLGDKIEFNKDFRAGDRFALVYQDKIKNGKSVGSPGPVIGAILQLSGKPYFVARYVGSDGKARYFDEKGGVIGTSFLRFPVQFSRISSYFSDARFHPVLRIRRPHNGVDFAAPIGTPVRSVASGRVVFAGYKGPSGNMVQIQHSDRYTTAYLHLAKIAPGVRRGEMIERGEMIGTVGQTGLATGPHLHYSLYDRGKYTDPLNTKLPSADEISGKNRIDRSYLNSVYATLDRLLQTELDSEPIRTVAATSDTTLLQPAALVAN